MKSGKKVILLVGTAVLLGGGFVFLMPEHQDQSKVEGTELPVVSESRALQKTNGKPAEAPELTRIAPTEAKPESAPATLRKATSQEAAFKEFLEKMSRHSEILHREFNLLEQLSAMHHEEGTITNHHVFDQMRSAFEELGRQASTNNDALQLLVDASKLPPLSGVAVAGLGVAGKNGNQQAIELLVEPERNGFLLSSASSALVEPARAGDEKAIQFMTELTRNSSNSALWWFASQGLRPAAEAGNEQAISGLVDMSRSTNRSVRGEVLKGLKGAAALGDTMAIPVLKEMLNSAERVQH